MRLLLLAAAALLGGEPGAQTIGGTISANSGSQITVSSADRSLTCAVPDKYSLVILKWGTGVRVGMACKKQHGHLTLFKLTRLDAKEPPKPADPPRPATPTTPEPAKPTEPATPTAPTPPARRDAIGVVVKLAAEGVAVKRDAGGEVVVCYITPAADSQSAATKLALGAHVGIVCRLDGSRYVLSGATTG
ncbi:MAG: hypothetical protein QOF43_2390 [Gaiellaceae bacterium]|jgi:hypothetical protein|nr:hypothetical protein [Gaiellaceae bacterium]